ncbi:MAG: hypothetical protein GY821_00955, partial [Gammaproteobacteria bacterium]|nr:hypothetical protein [Gammaproteobacteria bacterium]
MSGPIRTHIGQIKGRLAKYLDEAEDHRPFDDGTLQGDELLAHLSDLKRNTTFERNRMAGTIAKLEDKNTEWQRYVETLDGDELAKEEALYEQHATATATGFLKVSEAAEEQVFKFDQYLVDLDSLIGQLPSATQRQPLLQG